MQPRKAYWSPSETYLRPPFDRCEVVTVIDFFEKVETYSTRAWPSFWANIIRQDGRYAAVYREQLRDIGPA